MKDAHPALEGIDLERLRPLVGALLDDPATADDVLQETWLAARRNLPAHVRGGGQLDSWLRTTARRIAWRLGRRNAARAARERSVARGESDALRSSEGPADERMERLEALSLVLAALQTLAEPYRSAVVLRYLDGLMPSAIAKRLGRSPALVRQHLHRGLAQLSQELDRRAGRRSAWAMPLALDWPVARLPLGAAALATSLLAGALAWTAWSVLRPERARDTVEGVALATVSLASEPADVLPPSAPPTRAAIDPVAAAAVRVPSAPALESWTLTIVEHTSREPVVGARVQIATQGTSSSGVTDDRGRLELSGPGGWRVEAEPEGYAPLRARLESAAAVQGDLTASLVLLAPVGGQVLRPDGSGAVGAKVLVETPSWDGVGAWDDRRCVEEWVAADAQGRFLASAPDDPAALGLFALLPQYPPYQLDDVDSATWRALLEERAELWFASAPTIRGTVRDIHGNPVAGAQVRQRTSGGAPRASEILRTAETDEEGGFVLAHDDGGEAWLAVRAAGLAEERVAIPRELVADLQVDVVLSPATVLVVECYDPLGAPAADVLVEIEPWTDRTREEREQRTDAEGRAVFEELPPGLVDISIKSGTYLRPPGRQVDPRDGPQVYSLRLPLRFAGRLQRPEGGELDTYLRIRRRDRDEQRRTIDVLVDEHGRYDSGHLQSDPALPEVALGFELPGHAPFETPFFSLDAGLVEFDVRIE